MRGRGSALYGGAVAPHCGGVLAPIPFLRGAVVALPHWSARPAYTVKWLYSQVRLQLFRSKFWRGGNRTKRRIFFNKQIFWKIRRQIRKELWKIRILKKKKSFFGRVFHDLFNENKRKFDQKSSFFEKSRFLKNRLFSKKVDFWSNFGLFSLNKSWNTQPKKDFFFFKCVFFGALSESDVWFFKKIVY